MTGRRETKIIEWSRSLKAQSRHFALEIENDLTRRRFLAGAGSLLVLGAAGNREEQG